MLIKNNYIKLYKNKNYIKYIKIKISIQIKT